MNKASFLGLVQNVALLLAVAFLFDMVVIRWRTTQSSLRQATVGLALGAIGITVMLTPWTFVPGIIFDTRSVLLGISGLFFGLFSTVIAMAMTAAFRFYQGGTGAWTGIAVILISGTIGIVWRRIRRRSLAEISWRELYLFGIVIHLAMLATMLTLPRGASLQVLSNITLPVLVIYPLGTALLGTLMVNRQRRERTEDALRKSEEKYRNLFENANEAIFIVQDGKLVFLNPMTTMMIGYLSEQLTAKPFIEFIHPDDRDMVIERQVRRMKGEEVPARYPFRIIHRDDDIRWVELSTISINWMGKAATLNFLIDITERKRSEQETAILSEIGRVISSTLEIGKVYEIFAAEVRKLIPFDRLSVSLNNLHEYTQTVGYVSGYAIPMRRQGDTFPLKGTVNETILRTRTGLLIPSADIEAVAERLFGLTTITQEQMHSVMSVPLISHDEVIGALHFRSKKPNTYNEQDLRFAERIGMQIAGAIANAQMFNDLGKTERSLRESEERLGDIIYSIAEWVWEVDENGVYTYSSKTGFDLLGASSEDIIGKTPFDLMPPDEAKRVAAIFSEIMANKAPIKDLENWNIKKNGERICLLTNGVPILDENGNLKGYRGVDKDITSRKRMNEEKQSMEERLQRSEKMESLGKMAGGVAHDLNNVLGIMSGYSELLLAEIPEGHRSRGHAEKILQATEKGSAIIQDLLTLARRGVTVSDVINLNSVVSDFLKTPVFERMKDCNPLVAFRTECDKNLLNIKGSPVHMEKTLMNLVSNAVESISGMGEVTIRTESRYLDKTIRGYDEVKEGDYAVLTVSDTGMGIPDDSREKIFEPFYTKKTMGKSGTGLGLAIVWGTVKDLNGYIDVQSEVGKGSLFTLYFPVTREELIEKRQKVQIERYMGKRESVLVIDDVAGQRDVAAGLLTRLGYEVHVVSGGEEAVEYLKENQADILVLDMIMPPGIDGLETYQRVLAINPNQKAILVSGFSETERVREAQRLGAGIYVKKPYLMEKIGVAIRDELNR